MHETECVGEHSSEEACHIKWFSLQIENQNTEVMNIQQSEMSLHTFHT
jgi:hypothetical protein